MIMIRHALAAVLALASWSTVSAVPVLEPIAEVDLKRYSGTWYQVALYPNRFQAHCVRDTTATYRGLPDGNVEVLNRCRKADGDLDEALGLARPLGQVADGVLRPARLQVSFLPTWLRWAQAIGNWGWGAYWVIQLAPDYRYAVVSEGEREYLWVLSRTPALAAADEAAIHAQLLRQGFDLARLQRHPQAGTEDAPARATQPQ